MKTTETNQKLTARPLAEQRPIVFFDGVCGVCNASVDFLLQRDRRKQLLFAPLQGDTARERLNEFDRQDLQSMVLIDALGEHRRSEAAVRILKHLGGPWAAAGTVFGLVPRPLRDFAYNLVARNRYRLGKPKEACRLPTPEERARFLP